MNKSIIQSALMLMIATVSVSVMADNKWGGYKSVERHQQSTPYTSSYQGNATPYGHPFTQTYPINPPNYHHSGNGYPQYPTRPLPSYPSQGYPNHPNYGYPSYPSYPPQNGVTIIYNHQFPTKTEYSGNSYGYVNGAGGSIQSSEYTLITDWRRYGLPDPQVGMHWVYQNGRYVQIPNGR